MMSDLIYRQKFEALFKEYFTPLTYFAQKYISDIDTCKEIVHAIFVAIWDKRSNFDFDKPAKSYLFTSVANRCRNYFRDNKKMQDIESETSTIEMIPDSATADLIETIELETKIKNGIDSLPDKTKEIFTLNRFEGKKYAEIAEMKGISVKTVEAQMSKALKLLREHLKEYINLLIFILINIWSN